MPVGYVGLRGSTSESQILALLPALFLRVGRFQETAAGGALDNKALLSTLGPASAWGWF